MYLRCYYDNNWIRQLNHVVFPLVFTLKKVLRSSPLKCVLYTGFAKGGLFCAKSGCVLYADATYTRVFMVHVIYSITSSTCNIHVKSNLHPQSIIYIMCIYK